LSMYRAGTEGENKCQNSQHPSKRQIDFSHLKDAHGIGLRLVALTRSRADVRRGSDRIVFEVY
jgi:hypothetical protein